MKLANLFAFVALAPFIANCGSADRTKNKPEPKLEAAGTGASDSGTIDLQLASGCSSRLPTSFPVGFSDHCVRAGGLSRQVRVYRPKFLKPNAVVIALHGGGGSAAKASDPNESALGIFPRIADKENFLVIYPQATADKTGKPGWNDCRSDDNSKSGADDMMFLSEIVTQSIAHSNLRPSQIFVTGHSNGAMMSFRFAMEKSTQIGAIATVAGNLAKRPISGRCQVGPERPIPVMMTHATNDPFVPYEGGCVAQLVGNKCNRGEVLSAFETLQFWRKANFLLNQNPVQRTVEVNRFDGGTAVESLFLRGKLTVSSWILNGAGHASPSKTINKGNFVLGKQNQDIEFAEEAWNFFKARMAMSSAEMR